MSAVSRDGDERPWDLKLVEWMSRSSATARVPQKRNTNPLSYAGLAVFYWVWAVVEGKAIWFAVAIATTLICLGLLLRTRLMRRSRPS